MTLQELRLARKMAVEASTKIEGAAKEAKRDLTDKEKAEIEKRLVEHDELSATIETTLEDQKRTAKLAEARANLATPAPEPEARGNQPTTGQPGPETRVVTPEPFRYSPQRPRAFTQDRCLRLFGQSEMGHRERAYRSGRWFAAVVCKEQSSMRWCEEHGMEVRASSEGVNTSGGVLVLSEIDQVIVDLKEERGVFRRECEVVPMGSDTKTFVSRAQGVTAYAVTEGGEITESEMKWDSGELVARTWATLSRYSVELGEDAYVSIGDQYVTEIAYAFADKEDEAGFNGTGTETYHGIQGVRSILPAGGIVDAVSGNTAFSTLDLADFEKIAGALPQFAEQNAKWFISKPGFFASMQRLMDAAGGNTIGDLAGGAPKQFLGFPVVISQVLPTTLAAQTSTIVILFGDLRLAAKLGDRRGTTIAMSEHKYFSSNQIAIRGTTRFDIKIHQFGTASVAGPIMGLKMASS